MEDTSLLSLRSTQRLCRSLPPFVAQMVRARLYSSERAQKENLNVEVRAQTGSVLRCNTSDYHGYPFSVHGYCDWRNWAAARALCKSGDVILEIGANVGTETIGFSDIVGPFGKVYAFEPLPANFDLLVNALGLRQYNNIEFIRAAVSNMCGEVEFVIPPKNQSGIGHITAPNPEGRGAQTTIRVDCITLDSLAEKIPRVSAMFIDTEGAELSIILGGKRMIQRDSPALVLEASSKHLKRAGTSIETLFAELSALDYAVFEIGRTGLRRIATVEKANEGSSWLGGEGNWLCLPTVHNRLSNTVGRTLVWSGLLPCIRRINPICR